MRYALVLLAGCSSPAPAPAPAPPPPPAVVKPVVVTPPVLATPPWPAGNELVVSWNIASVGGDADVTFTIAGVVRRFALGKPGPHVYPGGQTVCDRRFSMTDNLAPVEADGDYAQLVFTDDDLHTVATFRLRRKLPEVLELYRWTPSRRTLLVTVPIPAQVELREKIDDRDGELRSNLETFGCGLDEGLSP